MPTSPPDKIFYTEQEIENQSFDTEFGVKVVEPLEYDGKSLQRAASRNVELLLDYVGGTNPIYIGKAPPGTASSDALWQIKKLAFDGNSNVTSIKFANGSPNSDQVWDDRAGLTYN